MSRKKTSIVMCYIGGLLIVAGCGVATSVITETAAQTIADREAPQRMTPARNDRLPARNDRLIDGLDGASYEPYKPEAVRRIQDALVGRGLYRGPIHGILDTPTMQAIYEFQKAHYGLQVCGIPTPRTRKILEQGSHTDPAP